MDPADAKEAALEGLREDILKCKGLGPLVLAVVFSARDGSLPDVNDIVESILDSMSLAGDEVISQHILTHRQYQDTSPEDAFGRLLVEQCCIGAGCILLNVRAPGDEHGACTRGLHCLDYGLTFIAGYTAVQSFIVLPADPISDLNPLHVSLQYRFQVIWGNQILGL
jgi:hypothetical protein